MQLSRDEFERLALQEIDFVDRVARSLTRHAAESEDLVQETYLRAVRAWQRFDLRDHGIRPWLVRILHNVHISRATRAARQPAATEHADLELAASSQHVDPSLNAAESERWEANEDLQRAMAQLPDELRLALDLWAVGDMTYQQIADVFEIPIGTVMSRLYRAKKLLRTAYYRRLRIAEPPEG